MANLKKTHKKTQQSLWLQVEVDNEIVINFLLSFISSLDFKPLFLPIEANSGSIYYVHCQSRLETIVS